MAAPGLQKSTMLGRVTGLVLACGVLVVSGCGGGHVYHASKLPPDLLFSAKENVQTVDLSRLASPAVSNQLIDKGDVLEVTVETGYGTEKPIPSLVRVGEDGSAMIPLVGRIPLAGMESEAAEKAIVAMAVERGVYRNPNVTVEMKRQRTNKITVVGAVDKPDTYELPRASSSVLAAIMAAGGLTRHAGIEVEIRRPARSAVAATEPAGPALTPAESENQQASFRERVGSQGRPASSMKINLVEAARQANGGPPLDDGDVVRVEVMDEEPIHVIGLITKPGEFELPANQDLRVLDAVALAGGVSTPWADKIHLVRRMPGRDAPVVIEISIKDAKRKGQGNLRLGAGDVVSIEQTPLTICMNTLQNFAHFSVGAAIPLP